MDLTGRIIAVLPASSGVSQRTGNPWMSQDYVIEVPGQFPRKCVFRQVFVQLNVKLLDAVLTKHTEHTLARELSRDFYYIVLRHPRVTRAL